MEHLLNLLWLVITLSLFAAVAWARCTGALRCSFALALGCTALLAIFLFPAVSMTDDLQRAKLDAETAGRSSMLTAWSAMDQQVPLQVVLLPLLLLLTWCAARLVAAEALSWSTTLANASALTHPGRPQAVRPPPVASLLRS